MGSFWLVARAVLSKISTHSLLFATLLAIVLFTDLFDLILPYVRNQTRPRLTARGRITVWHGV